MCGAAVLHLTFATSPKHPISTSISNVMSVVTKVAAEGRGGFGWGRRTATEDTTTT